jgi:serine/threonine protein kinase
MPNSEKMDVRSDIYSLGIVAYELVTGLRPNDDFKETDPVQMLLNLHEITQRRLVPPHEIVNEVDERLSEIICKMLATEPKERYQSAAELVDEVGRKYIYNGKYGPTKAGLRAYITAMQDISNIHAADRNLLRFLEEPRPEAKRGLMARLRGSKQVCADEDKPGVLQVYQPYEMNEWARKIIERGQNPARA